MNKLRLDTAGDKASHDLEKILLRAISDFPKSPPYSAENIAINALVGCLSKSIFFMFCKLEGPDEKKQAGALRMVEGIGSSIQANVSLLYGVDEQECRNNVEKTIQSHKTLSEIESLLNSSEQFFDRKGKEISKDRARQLLLIDSYRHVNVDRLGKFKINTVWHACTISKVFNTIFHTAVFDQGCTEDPYEGFLGTLIEESTYNNEVDALLGHMELVKKYEHV